MAYQILHSSKQDQHALIQFLDARIHQLMYIVYGIVCIPETIMVGWFWNSCKSLQTTVSTEYAIPWTITHDQTPKDFIFVEAEVHINRCVLIRDIAENRNISVEMVYVVTMDRYH
jgi:hypothetical protein